MDALGIEVAPEQEQDQEPPEPFKVLPENNEAVRWFMRLQRRWVISENSGVRIRLDDQAIQAQMEMRRIKKKHRAKLLDALMIMETAALDELNGNHGR